MSAAVAPVPAPPTAVDAGIGVQGQPPAVVRRGEAFMNVRKHAVLAAIVLLFTTRVLDAQSGNSTISGLVKDSTGAALPGVSIVIRNVETAVSFDVVSNEEGLYRVGALVPGTYRVEASVDGFEPFARTVTLAISQTLAIDVTLDVAQIGRASCRA